VDHNLWCLSLALFAPSLHRYIPPPPPPAYRFHAHLFHDRLALSFLTLLQQVQHQHQGFVLLDSPEAEIPVEQWEE